MENEGKKVHVHDSQNKRWSSCVYQTIDAF